MNAVVCCKCGTEITGTTTICSLCGEDLGELTTKQQASSSTSEAMVSPVHASMDTARYGKIKKSTVPIGSICILFAAVAMLIFVVVLILPGNFVKSLVAEGAECNNQANMNPESDPQTPSTPPPTLELLIPVVYHTNHYSLTPLTHQVNVASSPSTFIVMRYDSIPSFTAPQGYQFIGWHTNPDGYGVGADWKTEGLQMNITEPLTLYAMWIPTYTPPPIPALSLHIVEGIRLFATTITRHTIDAQLRAQTGSFAKDRNDTLNTYTLNISSNQSLTDFEFLILETVFIGEDIEFHIVDRFGLISYVNESDFVIITNYIGLGGGFPSSAITFTDAHGVRRYFIIGQSMETGYWGLHESTDLR